MATPPGFYNQGDQAIYAAGDFFIPQERFRAAPYSVNVPAADDPAAAGLPAVYRPQGGGSGGAYTGGIDDLIQNYELDTRNQYFGGQPTPLVNDLYQSKLDKTFMGFPSYRQIDQIGPFTPYNKPMDMDDPGASIENIIASRNVPLELTTAGRIQDSLANIKEGIGSFADKVGGFGPISFVLNKMDKFNTLPTIDQEFIKRNMGYRGPTVFGENTSGLSKDPFGINTRSAFGNYAEFVGKEAEKLGDTLSATGKVGSKFAGATFNPVTGEFELDDESKLTARQLADINKRTNMLRQRYQFYTQKEKERQQMIEQEKRNQEAREAQQRAEVARMQAENRDRNRGGYQSSFAQDRDFMEGPGGGRDMGQEATSPGSSGPGGSDTMGSFMDGGIVDLVDIYD